MKKGLLLINLGTPAREKKADIRNFLCNFLTDKYVINLPWLLRYLLVYLIIIPARLNKVTKAYQAIWTESGSPLMIHSQQLQKHLQIFLGSKWLVELAMRYGQPDLQAALNKLLVVCNEIIILPLYPQYSLAATGSSIIKILNNFMTMQVLPNLKIINNFYNHPAYITAQANCIIPYLGKTDFVLFSYHGLPQSHINRSGCKKNCQNNCPKIDACNQYCYRAQCYTTTRMLASSLALPSKKFGIAFQSRLGKAPWIIPNIDDILPSLIKRKIKNLTIACPSFVADCLETLEEIGIRARQQWLKLGGNELMLVPCLNARPEWVKAIAEIIKYEPN